MGPFLTDPTLHDKLINAMQNDVPIQSPAELTEREEEILRLVATGTSNKDIARQLFISSNTVKVHIRNIFGKIGVTSRTEAAVYAIHAGLTKTENLPGLGSTPQEFPPLSQGFLGLKVKPLFLWVSLLVMVIFVGVVTLLVLRNRTPKVAVASPAPVAPQRWQELAPLPTARSGLAVAVFEDRIYAISGETTQGVTGVMEQYDVATNLWTTLPSKPLPVTDINAAVIGGQIYIPGGRLASGEVTPILKSYDPSKKQWERHASLPIALSGYALVAFEGKLYVFGGWDGNKYLSSAFIYDPDHDKWTALTPMPMALGFAGAAVAEDKIYVIGGYDGRHALAVNNVYTPHLEGINTPWSQAEALPVGRYDIGIASIADSINIIGGQDASKAFLAFLPQINQWQALTPPPLEIGDGIRLAQMGEYLFVVGGQIKNTPSGFSLSYHAIYSMQIPFIISK